MVTGATSVRVAADECAFADARDVLVDAIVVAGDGSCADVGGVADFGVAEIGEVVGFGAFAEARFFISTKLPTCAFSPTSLPGRR